MKNEVKEYLKCKRSPVYFINEYTHIEDPYTENKWIPFKLWPIQVEVINSFHTNNKIVGIKSRQVGWTWQAIAYSLYQFIFNNAIVLVFSLREKDANYMLYHRFKGMYSRLPDFLKSNNVEKDSDSDFKIEDGGHIKAFSNTSGDSYTANLVFIDEVALIPNLDRLLRSVQPTVDNGGKIIIGSRPDKDHPESLFNTIYKKAKLGENEWHPVFIPWHAHPNRDSDWYNNVKGDILSNTGSLDALHEQYPSTDTEALSAKTINRRFKADSITNNYRPLNTIEIKKIYIPGLKIYKSSEPEKKYFIGVDPAEGNPNSDFSSATVICDGEEVAKLSGKFEVRVFSSYINEISEYYNNAEIFIERNNHGHAVIAWFLDNSNKTLLKGLDGSFGWQTNSKSKALLFTEVAELLIDNKLTIHSEDTKNQLLSIEGSTLRAPKNQHDDEVISFCLAAKAYIDELNNEVFVSVC